MTEKQSETLDAALVEYVGQVAAALRELRVRHLSYGDFHIERVSFGFDGEPITNIAIVPTEFDGLGVEVTP